MASRKPVLVRIQNTIWEFSAADFKRFGPDPMVLKLRARSARTRFVRLSGEWFRWTGSVVDQVSDENAATAKELELIRDAIELKEQR